MTRLEYASLMLLQIDFHLVLGAAIVYKYSDKVSAAEDDQRGGKVGAILTERQHMRLRLAATREHLASYFLKITIEAKKDQMLQKLRYSVFS
jgi:hypothetical protein